MPRKTYEPLSPDQSAWLRRWAAAQAGVLSRVLKALQKLLHDGGSPLLRQVYAAQLALGTLAEGREARGLWTARPPWRGTPPDLTAAQREHLAGLAGDAAR